MIDCKTFKSFTIQEEMSDNDLPEFLSEKDGYYSNSHANILQHFHCNIKKRDLKNKIEHFTNS